MASLYRLRAWTELDVCEAGFAATCSPQGFCGCVFLLFYESTRPFERNGGSFGSLGHQ
ncbi:MAG: hypothetical protein ABR910_11110 [Acidobacteriaceae bacterium]